MYQTVYSNENAKHMGIKRNKRKCIIALWATQTHTEWKNNKQNAYYDIASTQNMVYVQNIPISISVQKK